MIPERPRFSIVRFYYVILVVVLAGSCALSLEQVSYKSVDTDKILHKVRTDNDKRVTLQGIARVRVRNSFENISIRQVTVLGQSSTFHLEALAIFGHSLATLTSDGKRVVLLTPDDQAVFEDTDSFDLSYFYPDLPPVVKIRELIDVLFGKVPFGLWDPDQNPVTGKENNLLTVTYTNSRDSKTMLYINPYNGQIMSADIETGDNNLLHVEYSNYKSINGLLFPKKIKLSYLSNELQINYEKDLILNKETDIRLPFR